MTGAIIIAALAFFALIASRHLLALHFCMSANTALYLYLKREIDADRADIERCRVLFDLLAETPTAGIAMDLRVWSTRQAFPWLFDLIDRQRAEA